MFARRALMEGIWSGTAVTETSLTEAISLLRQALGDDVQDPQYLETVHRRGIGSGLVRKFRA